MLKSIDWMNRISYPVRDRVEWNDLIDWYKSHGIRVTRSKTDIQYWLADNSWNADKDQYGNFTLYVSNSTLHPGRDSFFKYTYHSEKEISINKPSGVQALKNLDALFLSRTGISRFRAFGSVEREDFRGFQYTPIIWSDSVFMGRTLHHFYKADISAAYPYQACKTLPDSHKSKRLPGRVPPDSEYKFAFYIKSNQLAIYDEFDTIEFYDHVLNHLFIDFDKFQRVQKATYKREYNDRFHFVDVPEGEEITILMKEARYTFDKEYSYLYVKRKEEERAKQICNISIGCMSSPKYKVNSVHQRHITSVIYARHMVRMMRLYDRIRELGGVVVSVVTDSIAWITKKTPIKVGERKKELGAFFLEYEDTDAYYKSHGVYAIKENDGHVKTWHQGYNLSEETLRSIKKVSDIDRITKSQIQIKYDERKNKFIEVRE